MYYAQIRKYDIANGPKIRSTLFVSGCTHGCPGCFNKEYQHFRYGQVWSKEVEDKFIEHLKTPNVKGLSILGGEPMDQIQDDDLLLFVKRVKEETHQNIWIYSGYTFEQLITHSKRKEILSYCDVLVDGKFVQELKDLKLRFKGSANQRIIDIPLSLQKNEVCLVENI